MDARLRSVARIQAAIEAQAAVARALADGPALEAQAVVTRALAAATDALAPTLDAIRRIAPYLADPDPEADALAVTLAGIVADDNGWPTPDRVTWGDVWAWLAKLPDADVLATDVADRIETLRAAGHAPAHEANIGMALALAQPTGPWQLGLPDTWALAVHRAFLAADDAAGAADPPPHPLRPLFDAYVADRGAPALADAALVGVTGGDAVFTRRPALADAITAAAVFVDGVEVDGEPVATPTADVPLRLARGLLPSPTQPVLTGAPRTLAGHATADLVLAVMAGWPLTGDERSRLRADTYRVASLAYAVTSAGGGYPRVTDTEGARWLANVDRANDAHIKRWNDATLAGAAMFARNPGNGFWLRLTGIERGADRRVVIRPPEWWRERGGIASKWRLTTALTVALAADRDGALARTLAGLEAALAYAPPVRLRNGRYRAGAPSALLVPEHSGGPGPGVFVPWRDLLRLAGEYVDDANETAARRRYQRRVAQLEAAGYFATDLPSVAPAGGAVEIVGHRRGGLTIRATARYCEAVRKATAGHWRTFALPVSGSA